MQSLEHAIEKFVRKLTTPGGMTATSFLVLGVTVLPLLGGPLKPYEVREFRAALTAYMDGETSTPSLEPAYYPGSGRDAPMPAAEARAPARAQHVALAVENGEELETPTLEGAELTSLETAAVAATFDEPIPACDADCAVTKEEPDSFAEEEEIAEYGPVEDAAF